MTSSLSFLIYRLRPILPPNLKSTEIFMICILMLSKCSEFLIKRLYRKYESIISIISTSNSKATSTYIHVENIQRENTHAYILLNLEILKHGFTIEIPFMSHARDLLPTLCFWIFPIQRHIDITLSSKHKGCSVEWKETFFFVFVQWWA